MKELNSIILTLILLLSLFVGCTNSNNITPINKPTKTISSIEQKEKTVYITNTGKKYHLDSCRTLRKSKISINLSDAKSRGFDSCKICNPPK